MKNLTVLSRLQFRGSRPIPLYRKLSVHNKVLLIISLLTLLLGLLGVIAFQFGLKVHFIKEYKDNFQTVTDLLSNRLVPMVLIGDSAEVNRLLSEENQFYESILYMTVTDRNGNTLGQSSDQEEFSLQYPQQALGNTSNDKKNSQDIKSYDKNIMEMVSPIIHDGETIGAINILFSTSSMNTFIRRLMTLYLTVLGILVFIFFLTVRPFLRYITRPIITLTRIADEISLGNLDLDIFYGKHVNCWEIKECGHKDCAAHTNTAVQCWFVDGTPCEGYEPKFPEKLEGCQKCEVYKTHKGDEIVQLADSFQHMIYMLKTSRAELGKSYKFQRNMIQNSLIGVIATNEIGVIKIFNLVAENLTGYSESETIDKLTLNDFFPEEVAVKIKRPLIYDYGLVLRGFRPMESEITSKNKEQIPVRLSGINLYEGEEHLGNVFFFQDFREVKRLRQELIHSERLSATGQAVASISHSIKNILDGLLGGVYVYKKGSKIKSEMDAQKGWNMIEKNIDLISELVIDLLNFSKERKPILQKCDPKSIVEDVIKTMENKARNNNVVMTSEYEGNTDNVYLDSHGLYQCLMNLVSNAIDASPSGRTGHIILRLESRNGKGIIFEVSDDGIGINKEIQNELFRGMVSTKGSKGTGLGLLVVNKIISEHGGIIEVNSEENKGTCFRIWLPKSSNNNSDSRISGTL
ncbi:MAG: ATP-binding protein [Syntrophales bacterium]